MNKPLNHGHFKGCDFEQIYGIIIVPAILILAPRLGVKGIYISNAISDGVASAVAIIYILVELIRLKGMEEDLAAERTNEN